MLCLCFCVRALSSCGKRGPLLIAMRGPLTTWPLSLRSTGSRRAGSAIVAHGPICSAACGIFPDQGPNPCPLHWQADSQPLRHQGSPLMLFYNMIDNGFGDTLPSWFSSYHFASISQFLFVVLPFLYLLFMCWCYSALCLRLHSLFVLCICSRNFFHSGDFGYCIYLCWWF